jgi:hypothetical protein
MLVTGIFATCDKMESAFSVLPSLLRATLSTVSPTYFIDPHLLFNASVLSHIFLLKLFQDVDSQLTSERLQLDSKLVDALTDAAVGGGLDDKQYAVGEG